jgi:hypothetical protein
MCLAVSTGTLGQQRGSLAGRYSMVTLSADTLRSPDGGAVNHVTYAQNFLTDDPNNPFNNTSARCAGTLIMSEEDTPIAGGGGCYATDMDGDGYWFWWYLEEAGTQNCPTMCGAWGSYNGHGKFEGVSSNGTFTVVASFLDGSMIGTSEGTYEIK